MDTVVLDISEIENPFDYGKERVRYRLSSLAGEYKKIKEKQSFQKMMHSVNDRKVFEDLRFCVMSDLVKREFDLNDYLQKKFKVEVVSDWMKYKWDLQQYASYLIAIAIKDLDESEVNL